MGLVLPCPYISIARNAEILWYEAASIVLYAAKQLPPHCKFVFPVVCTVQYIVSGDG